MERYVILGGGYGGLAIMNQLLEYELPADVQLVLVDRMPYQGLKTEYYSLAAGTSSEIDIRVSFPNDPRVHLLYRNVQSIDLDGRLIRFADGDTLAYDHLVIGLGCTDQYHGVPGAEQFGNSIQSLSSTRRTYQLLNDVRPYGQVSIIGGGLSGVEMAAELRESRSDLNIHILDRGARILSSFPEKLSHFVSGWFLEHDIKLHSFVNVSHLKAGAIYNQKDDIEEEILSDVTVWTAGIQPVLPVQQLQVPKDPQGRIVINKYHHIPEYPNVYVVGDCASLPFSPSAQAAGAQGKQIADVIKARWKGEIPNLGKIKLKGVLGALGKKSGFGVVGKRAVFGYVPRVMKSGVLWMSKHHFG